MSEASEFDNERELWRTRFNAAITNLSWSYDTNFLCVATKQQIGIINTEEAKVNLLSDLGEIATIAHAPSGLFLASADHQGQVTIWKTDTGEKLKTFKAHTHQVTSITWHPNGSCFCTTANQELKIWDHHGLLQLAYEHPANRITAVDWNPHRHCFTVAFENTILEFDPTEEKTKDQLIVEGIVSFIRWHPHEPCLALGTEKGWVKVYAPSETYEMAGYDGNVKALDWQNKSNLLAATGSNQISFWDNINKENLDPSILIGHKHFVSTLKFQNQKKALVSGDEAGIILFWRPDIKNELIDIARMPSAITAISWSPDDSEVAIGTANGELIILAEPIQ
ncbi:hypothetical protein RCC89_12250 [Cytophagaceae bacterium ABcell3]|nr:hypothetical protein RCC89_12250 [Cytophagaceae bacterium ABcell3]